ncbi:MAG: site-specific integrase, partial [Planctomycetes bacterium]|nr:site-specific integrase [Planctomycetota bacterium]
MEPRPGSGDSDASRRRVSRLPSCRGAGSETLSKYTKVFERVAELAAERKVKTLMGIDLAFIDAYRRMRTDEGAAAKTKYTETVIVRQLVTFALSRNLLAIDPLRGLKLKKPKPTPQPCWTPEQVIAILANAPETVRSAFTLLAETGMRFGELAWLTWDDVDVEANVLRIRPKEGWKPKSGDCRAIPISPVAQQILDALPRRWRWVVTMPPSATHPATGRQWTERRLLNGLKHVLTGLDFPGKLHTFRHAFISNALLKGTAVAVVREWVGHVDQQVIALYTHVHNNASQTAMQRLSEANQQLQKEEKSCERKEAWCPTFVEQPGKPTTRLTTRHGRSIQRPSLVFVLASGSSDSPALGE